MIEAGSKQGLPLGPGYLCGPGTSPQFICQLARARTFKQPLRRAANCELGHCAATGKSRSCIHVGKSNFSEEAQLRAREREIAVLRRRLADLRPRMAVFWQAMHSTGDLLRKFLTDDD